MAEGTGAPKSAPQPIEDQSGAAPLTLNQEHSINILMLNVALRNLLAQVATTDRNAKEAAEYIKSYRASLEDFISDAQALDDGLDAKIVEEMRNFVNLLLNGISFQDS